MKNSIPKLPTFYSRYVELIAEQSLIQSMSENGKKFIEYVKTLSEDQLNFRYAAEKWTAREVIMHMIDAERIFAYRALRFARNDKNPLKGFDENEYAKLYESDNRTGEELVAELIAVRNSTIYLFKSFDHKALNRTGETSGIPMSVNTIGKIIVGHELHHLKVLKEKYFSN